LQEDPYVIKKVDNPTSLEDYKGYIPDLLEHISNIMGSKFTLRIVADGRYGAQNQLKPGEWNGMMGEVMSGVSIFTNIYLNIISITCI